MANGEYFGISFTEDGIGECLAIGYCDTEIYNALKNLGLGSAYYSKTGFATLQDCIADLDSHIPSNYLGIKGYYKILNRSNLWANDLFNVYPNQTEYDSQQTSGNLTYKGEAAPGKWVQSTSAGAAELATRNAANDSGYDWVFPGLFTGFRTFSSTNNAIIGSLLIVPDDFITDKKINWGSDNPYLLNIRIEANISGGQTTYRSYAINYGVGKSSVISTYKAFWNGKETPIIKDNADPYEEGGGSSTTGGGTGTFSETGDTIGIPGLPSVSAVDTGFITLFNPTAAQVKSLAAYMWSSGFDITTFKNIVANPIDCILGLSIVPVNPPNAGSKVVTVGNISTGISLPYLSSQFVEVDCGSLNVQEFWGSYLDYSPYTKMQLYLPYIGIVPLDIDDVMNATIAIKYHVDVLSGACVAYVLCNGTQLYTYIGQCSANVPITSNDFTNTVNGILGIAGSIGSLIASGGASAPSAVPGIAANAINALKPNMQKSGALSGTGGLMSVQKPYLICQRPRQSVPASQNTFTGYPSNITANLGSLSGYTEVDAMHLEGIPCTNDEMTEIMSLLESGVIF